MAQSIPTYAKMGSYREEDVKFLLKDLSKLELEDSTEVREKRIQAGEHYSESLPIEYQPPAEYLKLFHQTLADYKETVAMYIGVVAEKILKRSGPNAVLVSLARAGTPIGILIRRYLLEKYGVNLPHYSVSIIRGKGLDTNAIQYILHTHPHSHLQFVDGWTGKGAISKELTKSCQSFHTQFGYRLDDTLAVVADPGHCTTLYGTREDFLIPSACLNSTVSGLVSRTVLNDAFIGPNDFHGAKFYEQLQHADLSNEYLDVITNQFQLVHEQVTMKLEESLQERPECTFSGLATVKRIMSEFGIDDVNFVKPGVGETTRVLLRRIPWKILVKDRDDPYVRHILMLCADKKVSVEIYPNMEYTCCGLIKNVR